MANFLKKINSQFKILFLLVTFVALAFVMSVSAKDTQVQIAPEDQLTTYYEAQYKHFYKSIPTDISQKYKATIAKVDSLVLENKLPGGISSKANDFDLDYYAKVIKIGVIPYLAQNDLSKKEFQELVNDIDKYTLDVPRLKKHNSLFYGEKMPQPTVADNSLTQDTVRISLNGSGYNVSKAVAYAYKWTEKGKLLRNSSYNYYAGKNDCTNFVSQVLHDSTAGNIAYIHNDNWGWDYDDVDNWYYANSWLNPPSYTWGGASNFYDHLNGWSTNVKRLYKMSEVKVGDIIQWDIEPNDGVFHIGHSTVVTKITKGTIYLTYHTTDKEDEPITTFTKVGYLAYAWAINH